MNKLDTHIAKKLVEFRKETDLSQGDIAHMLGLSRISVVNMEGHRQSFTTKSLYMLACIFHKEVGDFFPPVEPLEIEKVKKKVVVERKIIKPVFKVKKLPKF
jgi:DNA-binding XRE family transcriptional regulator